MKKTGCIVAAFILALFCVIPVSASEFKREVLESIVYIEEDIVVDGQFVGAARGTGFFVGTTGSDPQYLVTNYHVIEDFVAVGGGQADNQSRLLVAFEQNDIEEAYVVEYDEKMDLALLRLAKPTAKRKALKIETSFDVGDQVFAVGFPGLSDELISAVSSYSIDDASVTDGAINRLITESGTGRRLIQMNASIYGGNSGGPLVNAAGNVIGINTMGAEGMNYAVSIEEVIPFLERNHVIYDHAEETSGNTGRIAIAAAGVVIAAIVGVFVLKKKKSSAASHNQPAQRLRPLIYSTLPEHGRRKIDVGEQPVRLGRDASACQLVFRGDTPGVSRCHCQISWDAGKKEFVLTDLKSSYGTFLGNGQRLTVGTAYYIRPGDSFYLGERANEVRTELEQV